jgi:molecular chaperone DnaK
MYALGVDLGTTFTAAATWRGGHAEIASLGSRAAVIPSVVLLREDETVLTGESASRRGLSEPHRVAREFKRRLGDTTPILLGGVPYSAEALMARLLRSVVDAVAAREGGPAAAVCVSHPANWGPYKTDLLRQAVRLAGLEQPVSYTTEPEAAAAFYARQQRIDPGAVVAVYDLGGGTFDAAVLRKTATGFEILGQPEGIERLGGIDVDAAVFDHVRRALGGKLAELDEDDPVAIAAVARLKEECVQAKEALSSDTDVSIAVLLPNISTEVRLTRSELEAMVRPALHSTVDALKRALRSAGVTPEQLHSVLLVGGSSRMPIVAQLVGAELGRPVSVDAHPKHAVALGAAWLAGGTMVAPAGRGVAPVVIPPGRPAPAPAPAPAAPVSGGPVSGGPVSGGPVYGTPVSGVPVSAAAFPVSSAAVPTSSPPAPAPVSPVGVAPVTGPVGVAPVTGPVGVPPVGVAPAASAAKPALWRRRGVLVGTAVALVALLAAAVVAIVANRGGKQERTGNSSSANGTQSSASARPVSAGPSTGPSGAGGVGPAPLPADEQCTDQIKSNPRWVCLTRATFDGTKLTIEYVANFAGASPNVNGGYHIHIYGGTGTTPPDDIMGTQSSNPGRWYVEDKNPSVRTASSADYRQAIGNQPKVCGRIANGSHQLVPDNSGNGTYHTGNCVPVSR